MVHITFTIRHKNNFFSKVPYKRNDRPEKKTVAACKNESGNFWIVARKLFSFFSDFFIGGIFDGWNDNKVNFKIFSVHFKIKRISSEIAYGSEDEEMRLVNKFQRGFQQGMH